MDNVIKPYSKSFSIVVLGDFNPAIFHPSWFSQIDIFSDEEIENAIENLDGVIHHEIAEYNIGWCKVSVSANRYAIITRMDAYFERLRDLVYRTFARLHHTPVVAMGINPSVVFDINDETKWHNFGHVFAPKTHWNEILEKPGLNNLQIKGLRNNCKYKGHSIITLCPYQEGNVKYGVHFQLNDHYVIDAEHNNRTKLLLEVLENQYSTIMDTWEETYSKLINITDTDDK